MRTLPVAVVAATLAIPSLGYPQDQGLVGGRVGNTPDSSLSAAPPGSSSLPALPPGSPTRALPYGAAPVRAPAQRPDYAGSIVPGEAVPQNLITTPRPDGFGSAYIGGHRVIVDPSSNRVLRVLN
jgi:hypothetical protein